MFTRGGIVISGWKQNGVEGRWKGSRSRRLNWPMAQSFTAGHWNLNSNWRAIGAGLHSRFEKRLVFKGALRLLFLRGTNPLTNTLHTQLGNYIYLRSFIIYGLPCSPTLLVAKISHLINRDLNAMMVVEEILEARRRSTIRSFFFFLEMERVQVIRRMINLIYNLIKKCWTFNFVRGIN